MQLLGPSRDIDTVALKNRKLDLEQQRLDLEKQRLNLMMAQQEASQAERATAQQVTLKTLELLTALQKKL